MYMVYEMDLSVFTEIEELPSLPEFPTAARILEYVAQLEELLGRMKATSYGPTQPHLWLAGKIPQKTWEKARMHSYDDLVELLIELAIERENHSHMDKYLRKHCEGRPLLSRVLEGGRLNPTLSFRRAVVGS